MSCIYPFYDTAGMHRALDSRQWIFVRRGHSQHSDLINDGHRVGILQQYRLQPLLCPGFNVEFHGGHAAWKTPSVDSR